MNLYEHTIITKHNSLQKVSWKVLKTKYSKINRQKMKGEIVKIDDWGLLSLCP